MACDLIEEPETAWGVAKATVQQSKWLLATKKIQQFIRKNKSEVVGFRDVCALAGTRQTWNNNSFCDSVSEEQKWQGLSNLG